MPDSEAYAAESRVPEGLVGSIIPGILATLFVFARFYSRGILTRSLGADDIWIGLSWVLGITLTVLNCTFVRYGFGHHETPQDLQYATTTARLSYVSRIIYQLVLGTTKMGLCAFYLRIFQDRKSKRIIYCLMVFICLFTGPLEIYVIYQCLPNRLDGSGKPLACDSDSADLYVSAVCNVVADFLLLVFVVPRIFRLKMARKQKTALLAVVSLGVLVIIAAIVRLVEVLKFNLSSDKTWDMANITTWSAIEVDMGLFCASAPVIKPLIRKIASNLLSSSTGTASGTSQHGYHHQYGTGTVLATSLNRKPGQLEGVFEMGSQTNLKVQHPEAIHNGTHWDDSNSDEIAFGPELGKGAIVKTVSVSITSDKMINNVSKDRSVARFEPV